MSTSTSIYPLSLRNQLIGFDRILREIETATKTTYPPYNLIKIEQPENTSPIMYQIDVALAGFSSDDISISRQHGYNQDVLLIQTKERSVERINQKGRTFMHTGIGARDFSLRFHLHPQIKVVEATMRDGILSVSLKHEYTGDGVEAIPIIAK